MKTTMMFRTIANPRRTTLAHLTDDDEGVPTPQEPFPLLEHPLVLPAQTANPRRTVLLTVPQTAVGTAEPGAGLTVTSVAGVLTGGAPEADLAAR